MNQDGSRQTYQRAVGGAMLGLAIQAVFCLILLFLAAWPQTAHPATWGAFLFSVGGLPIWCCLALVFHQHRLEHEETLETERLLQKEKAASGRTDLFEQGVDELAAARKRLDFLHKWLIPITGLVVGVYLAATALLLLPQATDLLLKGIVPLPVPESAFLVMAFTGGITFLGFVAGRYVSGLSRQTEWQFLQGGAAYLMGTALTCALLALGFGLGHYELPSLLTYLFLLIPPLQLLLASEILLALLLGIYRPRRQGERARPAFNSRILGLLASPDSLSLSRTLQEAVNYQFGFEVTRSWFWKLLEKSALPLMGLALAVLFLFSAVVVIEPHQQGLVTQFGRLSGEPLGPGIHLKLPWPFAETQLYDVTRIHEVRVGSIGSHEEEPASTEPYLWSNEHAAHTGGMLIVAAPTLQEPAPKSGTGSKNDTDANQTASVSLVLADVPVQYRIKDLKQFTARATEAERMLVNIAEREVSLFMYARDVDAVLGPERSEAGPLLKQRIQGAADRLGLGVEIVFVGVAGIHPHKDVATAFYETVEAQQEKITTTEKARLHAIQMLAEVAGNVSLAKQIIKELEHLNELQQARNTKALPDQEAKLDALIMQAGGNAAKLIAQARSYRWKRENEERGKAERFSEEVRAHEFAPRVYRMRRYLEVLAEGLELSRKYLLLSKRKDLEIRLNLKEDEMNLPMPDLMGKE